jgi:hypothetical protein
MCGECERIDVHAMCGTFIPGTVIRSHHERSSLDGDEHYGDRGGGNPKCSQVFTMKFTHFVGTG